jgi:bifunctional NMN adenylyltransferase/nudix hydrolase
MVRRDKHPGKGLWALPGGFIEPEEPILDGALRELLEETRIDIREKILRKNIVAHEVFDAPMRSSRGRTVTHAYLIHLDAGPLPATAPQRGEVQEIRWVPLAQLDRSQCFEDHYSIIKRLTAHI